MSLSSVERAFCFIPQAIPPELKAFDRWSPWRAEWNEKRQKFDKLPQLASNPLFGLSSAKPDRWVSFEAALAGFAVGKSAGLGFVMTGVEGLVAVDLDHCLDAPWALAVIEQLDSYTELSPSGLGYRIFCKGVLAADWTNHEVGIEVYGGQQARFLTVTGDHVFWTPCALNSVAPEVLAELASQYAKERRDLPAVAAPVPELLAVEALPSVASLALPDAAKRFLLTGAFDLDRSATLFGVGVSLFAAGHPEQVVFSILAHNAFALEVALDHRRQQYDRALLYLWQEHCIKAKPKGQLSVASSDDFEALAVADGPALPAFKRDNKGQIEATIENVALAVRRADLCGMEIRHDQFRDEIMFKEFLSSGWQTFRDADYSRLRIALEKFGFKPVGRELIRDVVLMVSEEQTFDSAMVWLKDLSWDGVPRVEGFFEHYFGAEESDYMKACSLYLWTALAGRGMVPGIKADMVPILIGEQGTLKSSSVAAMVPSPDFFVEVSFQERDDDLARKMRGRLLAEIGELRGLHSRELESIKAFITRTHESWVPKYREFATSYPRRLVFIGTTNQSEFLADETGNRRFLPIKTQKAKIEAIKNDRLQLWAEALVLFKQYGVMYQAAEALAPVVQAEHLIVDPWEDEIARWLDEPDLLTGETPRMREFLQTQDVARECLRIEDKHFKRIDQIQICKILRLQGYRQKNVRINGKKMRIWDFEGELEHVEHK